MHNGQKYSHMCVGWFMYTFGDYILAFLAWKNHIVANLGDVSIMDKMHKSLGRLDKHPIITNTHAQWSKVFTYVCSMVYVNFWRLHTRFSGLQKSYSGDFGGCSQLWTKCINQ